MDTRESTPDVRAGMQQAKQMMKLALEQLAPEGDERKLKQAFYNAGALLFVCVLTLAAYAVYYVLQYFISPLVWAVLIGAFLHPFKASLSQCAKGWLVATRDARTPLLLSALALPLVALSRASDILADFLLEQIYVIVTGVAALVAVYVLNEFAIFAHVSTLSAFACSAAFLVGDIFLRRCCWLLVITYVPLVLFLWTPEYRHVFTVWSSAIWLGVAANALTLADMFTPGSFLLVAGCLAAGHFHGEILQGVERMGIQRSLSIPEGGSEQRRASERGGAGAAPRRVSDRCFVLLFWLVAGAVVWRNLWLVQFLPLLLIVAVLRRGIYTAVWHWAASTGRAVAAPLARCVLPRRDALLPQSVVGVGHFLLRIDRFVLDSIIGSVDTVASGLLLVLMFVAAAVLGVFLVMQIQRELFYLVGVSSALLNDTVHPELHRWLPGNHTEGLIDSATYQSLTTQLYGLVRNFLVTQLDRVMSPTDAQRSRLDGLVLDLWDQFYNSYVATNASLKVHTAPSWHFSENALVQQMLTGRRNWTELLQRTALTDGDSGTSFASVATGLDLWYWVALVRNNVGLLLSIVESVWTVVRSNVTVVLSALTTVLSLLLSSWGVLLNLFVSAVIFSTAVFYLLAHSERDYIAMRWLVKMTPSIGSRAGDGAVGFDDAISGVLLAALKMLTFYGLYAWAVHSLFDLNVVFIPSLLSALLAAVPFLGTYWAGLPGVVELLLVYHSPLLALLFLLALVAPTYVFDTAVYGEIKGAGHPYLTGLAIVGGVYCFGVKGAFLGPIILCSLIICVNLYDSFFFTELPPLRRL